MAFNYSDSGKAGNISTWGDNNPDPALHVSHHGLGPAIEALGTVTIKEGSEDRFIFLPDGFLTPGGGATAFLCNSSETPTILMSADSADAALIELKNAAGLTKIKLDADLNGKGRVVTQELEITGGSDLSEQFNVAGDAAQSVEPGMVVAIDPDCAGELRIADRAYDSTVAGVVSGAGGVNTGMMMGQAGSLADGAHPVALSGRVYAWCDASHGPIRPGDLLTTSDTPGHAMKAIDRAAASGAIIGKAMTSLDSGRGLVLVLVNLQ